MAYIHVKFDEKSPTVTLIRLDGWNSIMIKREKYIEVSPGNHVVELYGPNTNYNIRGKLNDNDVFEIVVLLGIDSLVYNCDPFFTLACEPEFYIRPLGSDEKKQIEEKLLAEQREMEKQKEKERIRGIATAQIICGIFALIASLYLISISMPVFIPLGTVALSVILIVKAIQNFRRAKDK